MKSSRAISSAAGYLTGISSVRQSATFSFGQGASGKGFASVHLAIIRDEDAVTSVVTSVATTEVTGGEYGTRAVLGAVLLSGKGSARWAFFPSFRDGRKDRKETIGSPG
jgi:hypothetical protein